MVMGGVPAIVQRVSQTEQMGRKGVEWATMLRDELSWQDEMEEAEQKGEEAGDNPAVDGADGAEEDEEEQVREAVGAAPEDDVAAAGGGSPRLMSPEAQEREEALAKQRAESLAAAMSDATAETPEEGVPEAAAGQPEPEPEPEPSATDAPSSAPDASAANPGAQKGTSSKKSARAPNKIGNELKDDAPSLNKQDADQLREMLKRLEEFDQVCGKVRAAGDKPTAMRYAARRKELCKELATPVADALDIQEAHYAAMHARLQRIAASLKKLEMKAAELLAVEEMHETEEPDRAGTQLAVVGRALSHSSDAARAEEGSERKTAAQHDMEDAQAALDDAMKLRDTAEVSHLFDCLA